MGKMWLLWIVVCDKLYCDVMEVINLNVIVLEPVYSLTVVTHWYTHAYMKVEY